LSNNDIGYTPYSGFDRLGLGLDVGIARREQGHNGLSGTGSTITVPASTSVGKPRAQRDGVLTTAADIHVGGFRNPGSSVQRERVIGECDQRPAKREATKTRQLAEWNSTTRIRFSNGASVVNMWTPRIHDKTIHDNFATPHRFNNKRTNVTVTQAKVREEGVDGGGH